MKKYDKDRELAKEIELWFSIHSHDDRRSNPVWVALKKCLKSAKCWKDRERGDPEKGWNTRQYGNSNNGYYEE